MKAFAAKNGKGERTERESTDYADCAVRTVKSKQLASLSYFADRLEVCATSLTIQPLLLRILIATTAIALIADRLESLF